MLREWLDRLRYRRWDRQMGTRRSENEMWLWDDVRVNGVWDKRIRVFARPRNWPALLVMLEMAGSNADAQRHIRSGAIELRSWTLSEEWRALTLTTPMPAEPTYLRRGKKYYGIKQIWLPPAGISERHGDEMLRRFT